MKQQKAKRDKTKDGTKKTPPPLSYFEVALAMMTKGQGLEYLEGRDGPIPGKTVLIKAFFELTKRGSDKQAEVLKKWTNKQYPPRKQGRNAPEPGSHRVYSIQNQGGGNFARIPVEILGLGKGDQCMATFKAGQIVITVAPVEKKAKVVKLRRRK
jgi:hypothetical protein